MTKNGVSNEDRIHPVGMQVLMSKDTGCVFMHETPILPVSRFCKNIN